LLSRVVEVRASFAITIGKQKLDPELSLPGSLLRF